MSHFPKPFFKKSRKQWYVEIQRRQICLGPDRDEAFRRYHELMRQPGTRAVNPASFASIVDAFLEWVKNHRAPAKNVWAAAGEENFFCPILRTSSTTKNKPNTPIKPWEVKMTGSAYLRT